MRDKWLAKREVEKWGKKTFSVDEWRRLSEVTQNLLVISCEMTHVFFIVAFCVVFINPRVTQIRSNTSAVTSSQSIEFLLPIFTSEYNNKKLNSSSVFVLINHKVKTDEMLVSH